MDDIIDINSKSKELFDEQNLSKNEFITFLKNEDLVRKEYELIKQKTSKFSSNNREKIIMMYSLYEYNKKVNSEKESKNE